MIGTQLMAAKGYLSLERDCVYHFLENNGKTGIVSLVRFWTPDDPGHGLNDRDNPQEGKKKRRPQDRAFLVRLQRKDFEAGLTQGNIVFLETQHLLPPWFKGINEAHLLSADERNPELRRSHEQRIKERIETIQPAVDRKDEILAAEDPMKELGRLARACHPRCNETRYKLWFFTYVAFGKRPTSLHYAIGLMGRWDRLTSTSTVRRGAPNLTHGPGYGSNADTDMVEKIVAAYRAVASAGVTRNRIYRTAITKHFQCVEQKVGKRRIFVHPNGERFPTRGMFWYWVHNANGTSATRRTLVGPRKDRTKYAPFVGSFSSDTANLMERVEQDGYYLEEIPRALTSDADLKPLVVVRIRDVRSGLFTGIGFSHGGEAASAYRMAKFVQAVDKVWLCGLFGVTISRDQWPSMGASPNDVQDRGPGSTAGAFSSNEEFRPVIIEGTPSRSPQSKSLIEASNPRSIKLDDTVHYMRSDKSVIQLCVQEIFSLILANDSTDVSDRVPTDLLAEVEVPTPLNLWVALDSRMRNDGLPMTRDEAIVAFLTPVEAKLTRRGVELLGRVFSSAALDASGLREKLNRNQRMSVQAYVLEACVRHIWIAMSGQVIEVDMMTSFRSGDAEVRVSLSELKERADQTTKMTRGLGEHRVATESAMARDYEEQTGLKFQSAKRQPGKPKYSTSEAKSEARQTKEIMKGKDRK